MSIRILIVITLCLTAAIDCKEYRYDYVYYRQIQGWLKQSNIPVTWHQARLQCQLEGAELASPLNNEFLKVLKIRSHVPTWTGIHSLFSKGDYNSIEGVPILRMPISWAPGEPNNYENKEQCIIILPDGTFADVRCDETFPYFCYRAKFTFDIDNACGTVDHRYVYESRTGSCYKFHNHVQTWYQAFMTCAAEGAYLAITDTAVETQVLRELFSRYPASNIFGLRTHTDDALIGFQDWGEAGLWSTIHGQFFEHLMDTGVISWASGQPNNLTLHGVGQSCGGITRAGRFNDVWCHVPFAFICEKDPDSLKKGPESLEKGPDSLEEEEDGDEIDELPAAIQLVSVDEN